MRKAILISIAALMLFGGAGVHAQTFEFARRDTCTLYLDVHQPSPGAELCFEGIPKPTILYVFGGGFIMGRRDDPFHDQWFKILNDNGYRVVSIDYRLGLKGQKMQFDLFHLLESAKKTKHAVDIGVEDVFSAISYLGEHASELGIDMDRIVIAGSSAGAMISLSAEWEICKGNGPKGFRAAGVMSFAGAIMSDSGTPSYPSEPCPQLLIHGTADQAVNYDKTSFGNWGMFGSNVIAKVLAKNGYTHCIYRYKDFSHAMAANYVATWPEQKRFLEENVIKGVRRNVDALVDDPTMPKWFSVSLDDIYKKK